MLNVRQLQLSLLALVLLLVSCDDDGGGKSTPPIDDTSAADQVLDQVEDSTLDLADSTSPDTSEALDVADTQVDTAEVLNTLDVTDLVEVDVVLAELCSNWQDDNGDGLVDCDDPLCAADPICPAAVFAKAHRWRATWSDEFNGPEPGQESCYENATTPPQCLTLYWGSQTCTQPSLPGLDGLNKCNWSVFDMYNWMDNDKPLGEGVNAFAPELVEVTGGALILRSQAKLPAGGLPGGWSMAQVLDAYDCGTPPATGFENAKDCPIVSGGLWSKRMGAVEGLSQTYGRFDVRAQLPIGPGSWPAHWMLPQEGGWPDAGEIDIMEATSHAPSYEADNVAANFHDGVQVVINGETVNTHMSIGAMGLDMTASQQRDEFHVYSVEWDPAELRFFVDGHFVGRVPEGLFRPNQDLATGASVGSYALDVPDHDFYMILNSTVAAFGTNDYPDPRGFVEQRHTIDYVRAWTECSGLAEECPNGGQFDGEVCELGLVPQRADVFLVDGALVYPALVGATPCPDGGRLEQGLCIVYDQVPGAHTFVRRGHFVSESACHETTLPQYGNCPAPCGGIGNTSELGCKVGAPPDGGLPSVLNGAFVYTPLIGADDPCPVGRKVGDICEWASIPTGRVGSASLLRLAYYLEPVCAPDRWMPNCASPCPAGTEFDGARCVAGYAPPGSNPFVWSGGYYYDYLNEAVYLQRCPVGSDDGAHCYVGSPSSGTALIAQGNQFAVPASCQSVPRLSP